MMEFRSGKRLPRQAFVAMNMERSTCSVGPFEDLVPQIEHPVHNKSRHHDN